MAEQSRRRLAEAFPIVALLLYRAPRYTIAGLNRVDSHGRR